MKNKLKSMVNYVLANENMIHQTREKANNDLFNMYQYANFMSQKPEIEFFVPCDEDGNVLEEPSKDDYSFYTHKNLSIQEEYQQAKEACIFEGFEVKIHHQSKKSICTTDNIFHIFWDTGYGWELSKGILTIEDLVKYNVTLTDKEAKRLGL